VFDAVKATLSKIEDLGNTFTVPEDKKEWYGLLPLQLVGDSAEAMEGVESETKEPEGVTEFPSSDHDDSSGEDSPTQRDHDNNIVMFVDVICRVSTH
jgi:E3 ubiquitin-protein ligase HUWE1